MVNVAMPAIRNSVHFSEGGLAWMVAAYMVPFGGFLLLGGRTGDLLGRRRVLVAGTAVFAAASLGSALAPSAGVMIATRAVEGLAAAFVVPMTLALLTSVFPAGPPRTRAFSVWGGISAAAGTLGLVVGGALVSAAGWRAARRAGGRPRRRVRRADRRAHSRPGRGVAAHRAGVVLPAAAGRRVPCGSRPTAGAGRRGRVRPA
ncbi:MAG: MFS transporter [Trebonia sp.]